jgi:two-component system response regulator (stage 0 sporulation protein F)
VIKILAVDDEKGMTDILCKSFNDIGFHITSANTADEALKAIQSDKPNIVFLDITLGTVSGLDVLKKIKDIDSSIRVIMLTVHGKKALIDRAKELGADEYIRKPFNMDELEQVVVKMIHEIVNGKSAKS